MEKTELQRFYHQYCRFKLKSGKEVFGIIWEERDSPFHSLCFASKAELLKTPTPATACNSYSVSYSIGQTIDAGEIAGAEPILSLC